MAIDNSPIRFDHSAHDNFIRYYEERSLTDADIGRFRTVRDIVTKYAEYKKLKQPLAVADIGCGAGTSSRIWAEAGHRVVGIDINEQLIEIGRTRVAAAGEAVELRVGSATELPLDDESVDVVCAVELLEHVYDWEAFVSEAIRILAPGGLLYMNTTNVLCPKQQEFNLPLFSWYPKPLKEHYIKLASTTRPELANYATYPAYHWFSPYRIKKYLAARGLSSADRFDVAFFYKAPGFDRRVIGTIRKLPPLRYLAHMMSPCITVLAQKTH